MYRGSVRTSNRTPFWHLPRGSCAWGVFGTFCHQPTPKVSDSPSQHRKQVEPLLWCLSSGYLPRWSCAWGVFGTFCQQPTPKVSDSPSQPRKQVKPLLWCLSSGYRGSVRTTNRNPFWHLPRWSCAWGVFGTFCHQPTPKVSDSPSQPRKQVEPLLWCPSSGYRGSGRTTNTPFWHLPRWSCAWGVFGTFCHQLTPKDSDCPSQPRKLEPPLWCLSAGYRGSVRTLAPSPLELCMGCLWNILSPADSKSQRFPISAQKAGRTTFVVSFIWLPGQCQNKQQNSFLAPSPGELCMGCVWNILSPADSKSQRFPISAQKAGRTTFVVSFIWLPGQCQNKQQNSLAPSPVELCMGCVWNILSPADSKSQRFPISAQKAGRTTFVVSFIWLPGQCQNKQQNSFLAPSPGELCMGCVWNILSPADSKSQRLPISAQKAGRCDERGEASGRLSVSDKASFILLRRDYVLYTVPVNFMPTNHLLIG